MAFLMTTIKPEQTIQIELIRFKPKKEELHLLCIVQHLSVGISIQCVSPFSLFFFFFVQNYAFCDDDTIAIQFTVAKDTPTAHPFVFACLHTQTKTQLKLNGQKKGEARWQKQKRQTKYKKKATVC